LRSILSKGSGCRADQREALMYFEIDHHSDAAELEALRTALEQVLADVRALAQSWQDGLRESLVEAFGEEQASAYFDRYQHAFPRSYQDNVTPHLAALDIGHMVSLTDERRLALSFCWAQEDADQELHLKLFNPDSRLPLSDVLPMFEN